MNSDRPARRRRRDLKGDARREQILRMLAERGQDLSVEEIASNFGISLATVRRDLARLHQEEGVARTYGGVTLIRPPEVPTRVRRTTFRHAKQAIGRAAADLIDDEALVLLDAGSTTSCLADELRTRQGLTVATNGIGVASSLLEAAGVDVIVLGGRLRGINETITGAVAEEMLRHLHPDIVFLGTDALDPLRGIACRTFEQSRMKSLMMQRGARVVLLADSTKLDGGEYQYWSELDRPWELITDAGATSTQLSAARRAGATRIHLAHDDGSTKTWPPPPSTRQEIS